MDISRKQRLVLQAIENNPSAADDDAVLLSECWAIELRKKGIGVSPKQLLEIVKNVSRAETLTRRRRELFNKGLINYSEEASTRRMSAFKNELEMHSDNKIYQTH